MLDRAETLLDKGVTASDFLNEIDRLPLNTQAIADALYTITAVCLGTEQPRAALKAANAGNAVQVQSGDEAKLMQVLDCMLATGRKMLLIQGAPGAGKSTLARKLCDRYGTKHFEADMYFERGGRYKFDKNKLHAAHSWCKSAASSHFKNSGTRCTIVSNTFAKPEFFEPYLDIAGERDNCIIVRLLTEHDNIHGAPDDVVEKMRAAIASDTTPADVIVTA